MVSPVILTTTYILEDYKLVYELHSKEFDNFFGIVFYSLSHNSAIPRLFVVTSD